MFMDTNPVKENVVWPQSDTAAAPVCPCSYPGQPAPHSMWQLDAGLI